MKAYISHHAVDRCKHATSIITITIIIIMIITIMIIKTWKKKEHR